MTLPSFIGSWEFWVAVISALGAALSAGVAVRESRANAKLAQARLDEARRYNEALETVIKAVDWYA
jgi:hypothetical protein